MSNYSLSYRLNWLPRLLRPSLAGDRGGFAPVRDGPLHRPPDTVRLAFVGDISAVAGDAPPAVDESLRSLVASADLVIGNCESPIVAKPRHPLATTLGLRHAMDPRFLIGLLRAAAIPSDRLVLSLANNHALDQDVSGLEETQAALRDLGIRAIGAGAKTQTIQVAGLTVALVAFSQWRNAGAAGYRGRVVMAGDLGDGPLAEAGGADLVCVVPHWDVEFRHFPQAATRSMAGRLAKAGATLVVGHHAHVVQPVERVGETLVAYGLGDFVGTAWRRVRWPLRIGAVLLVDVACSGARRGRVERYEMAPFFRLRQGRAEKLVRVGILDGDLRRKVEGRLAAIWPGGHAPHG